MKCSFFVITVACGMIFALFTPPLSAGIFQGLGDLPGGFTRSSPQAISSDGRVVIGESHSAESTDDDDSGEAFRWTAETGIVALGLPFGQTTSKPYGITNHGDTIVGTANGLDFIWTVNGGNQEKMMPSNSQLVAISADGTTQVGYRSDAETYVFRSTAANDHEVIIQLGFNALSLTKPIDVSNDGSVVVASQLTGPRVRAVRWSEAEGLQELPLPANQIYSQANSVSADGKVVVGVAGGAASGNEAFRWDATNGLVTLGSLATGPRVDTEAISTNADGSIVVGYSGDRAFIWNQAHGMQDLLQVLTTNFSLDLSGWTLSSGIDISDDGRTLTGRGFHNGVYEAWIAAVPEPSSCVLAALSFVALIASRRFNR